MLDIDDECLLTVMIPSHDRFDALKKSIEETLKAESKDFEILIGDSSSGNIFDYISIKDSRLRIFQMGDGVNGFARQNKMLYESKGKYIMSCLDKDCVLGKYLDELLELLRERRDIAGGYCGIYNKEHKYTWLYTGDKPVELYDKGIQAVMLFGYRFMRHPSGSFYLKSLAKNISADEWRAPRFVLTECALKGTMVQFKKPLIRTETGADLKKIKSFTYSEKNIWFYPGWYLKNVFYSHLLHANSLNLSNADSFYIVNYIFRMTAYAVTYAFRLCFSEARLDALLHYNISPRHVGILEMLYWYIVLCCRFFIMDLRRISAVKKIRIIMNNIPYVMKLVKNLLYREECINFCKSRRNVYIYGIGKGAKECLNLMKEYGMNPIAYIVSPGHEERDQYDGKPVKTINNVFINTDQDCILVSVGRKYRKDILKILSSYGYKDNVYAQRFFE